MDIKEFAFLVLFVLLVSFAISIIKIYVNKIQNGMKHSVEFIKKISSKAYKKEVLTNNYPPYFGDLEEKDTEEFIAYLHTNIIEKIDEKSERQL